MKPTVSVIIPSKNSLSTLPHAIESIWQQNCHDIEIIMVDDGSTDGTWEWICQLCRKHNNIIALKLNSEGSSTARNHAARVASGTYIAFLDADKFWYQNKLQQQVKFMEDNPQLGISFTNCELMSDKYNNQNDRINSEYFDLLSTSRNQETCIIAEGAAAIFSDNVIGTSTVLVRRDLYLAVDGFDHNIKLASDWDLWLKITLHTAIGYIKKPLTAYKYKKSIVTNTVVQLKEMEQVIKRYEQKIKKIDPYAVRSAHARLAERYAEYYRQTAKPSHALLCDFKALCEQPEARRLRNIFNDLKLTVYNDYYPV